MVAELVTDNPWTLTFLLIALLCFWSSIPRRSSNVPPGPLPLPVVGNLIHFLCDPREKWGELHKRYGDVYSLYMGHSLTIVLHTRDVIKEAFIDHADETSDRPDVFVLRKLGQNKGLASASGPGWREHRLFTLKTLKEFGLDKLSLEKNILEEISALLKHMNEFAGKAFDISEMLHTAVSNVICSLVFGTRFEHDDPDFVNCLEKINANGRLIDATGVLNIFPSLIFFPKDPTKIHQVLSNQNEIFAFIRSQMWQHKRTLNREKPRDFIDAYLINFKEKQKRNPDTAFSEEQLTRVVSDLFVAGSETTASTLLWLILYMVTYPDVQDRVHQELDDVLKMEAQPLLSHRPALPFLRAVICETQRYADILPIGAPHAASKAFELHGYHIPQGAILLPFLHGVHFHPSWGDPDVFRPSRFLDDDLAGREMLLPFSTGRRSCIGEQLAKTELFLFAAAILKCYRFALPTGDSPPRLRAPIGHTVSPLPFRICAHRRISRC